MNEGDTYPDSGTLPLIRAVSFKGYRKGLNLSPEARQLITSLDDLWRISLIDNIPLPTQKTLGYAVMALQKRDYALRHGEWFHGEKLFLGMHLGHEPTDDELADDFKVTHVPERFRLFYLLTFPDKMALADRTVNGESQLFHDFLNTAEQISGFDYKRRFMRVCLVPAFETVFQEDYQI